MRELKGSPRLHCYAGQEIEQRRCVLNIVISRRLEQNTTQEGRRGGGGGVLSLKMKLREGVNEYIRTPPPPATLK